MRVPLKELRRVGPVGRDVFDLDAAGAAIREALGDPFRFVYGGEEFTVPPVKAWPIKVTALLAEGDMVGAMRLLLGPEQAERMFDASATPLAMGDVEALFTAIARWSGVGEGFPN